jgi:hypothetical protein
MSNSPFFLKERYLAGGELGRALESAKRIWSGLLEEEDGGKNDCWEKRRGEGCVERERRNVIGKSCCVMWGMGDGYCVVMEGREWG